MPVRSREAEAAATSVFAAGEAVEQPWPELLRNARPVVGTTTCRWPSRCSAVRVTGGAPCRVAFDRRFETTRSSTIRSATAARSTRRC